MKHLFKQVRVVDSTSAYHNQEVDLLIEGDQIKAIGDNIYDEEAKISALKGSCVSPGWVEMHSNFCDPGFEDREDLVSGAAAAAAGGFTSVCLVASTHPVVQSKADVEYLIKKGESSPVHVYPLGALSKQLAGKQLTEMYDMHLAGAVGFYDDKKAISNPNLLKLALLYSKEFASILIHPRDAELTEGGQMNEGATSTALGLRGIPAFAEELMIARDLFIARYTDSKLHFAGISTKGAVQIIREAKEKGQPVTADVNFYNLVLDDRMLMQYDTLYKVNPPLREPGDCNALIEGLKDGTIDAIAVDHIPQDVERKRCEFDHAAFGMAAIESAFGALSAVTNELGLDKLIEKFTAGPRAILNLPKISITEGSIAELTFFNPEQKWTLTPKMAKSKAANNPFVGREMRGKVIGTFNKGTYFPA
jgi:dihydroorotase